MPWAVLYYVRTRRPVPHPTTKPAPGLVPKTTSRSLQPGSFSDSVVDPQRLTHHQQESPLRFGCAHPPLSVQ